jgi:hypothetical protein
MAIHVDRITVGQPTLNAITLGAGGSLTVGVPYYYRVIAVYRYRTYTEALSLPSAEQSVTPTAGNQTAELSWTAPGSGPTPDCYIIQRTTTSGSYPLDGTNSFTLYGQAYYPGAFGTTLLYLDDDNGAASNVRFCGYNFDHSVEHPVFDAYGDSDELITFYDIWSALVGGGYTEMDLVGSALFQAHPNWQSQGLYTLQNACLVIRSCQFQWRGPLAIIGGTIVIENTTTLLAGHATINYSPVLLLGRTSSIYRTQNNSTYKDYLASYICIQGKSGASNVYRLFVFRPISYDRIGAVGGFGEIAVGSIDNNLVPIDCMLGAGVSGGAALFNIGGKNNIFESFRPMTSLSDLEVRLATYPSLYNANNIALTRMRIYESTYDLVPWDTTSYPGKLLIDCKFQAKNQVDNQPYHLVRKTSGCINTCVFAVNQNFLILDAEGNPIQNAEIVALNANGLSAFWEDSLTTFMSALDGSTDPSTLTVSDGTKFSVDDYIRCECYGEVLKVTNMAGNNLTVARAQLGTMICATSTSGYPGCSKRVMKMLGSITTDADGRAGGDEPTLQREIYSVMGSGSQANYEGTLITNGYLNRNFFGPYNLTISKDGYQDYQASWLDPDIDKYPLGPVNLEVAMGTVPPPVYVNVPSGEVDITLAAPAQLGVALVADEIKVQLNED